VVEFKVVQELNRARTNPRRYAQWLATLRTYYSNNQFNFPGEDPITFAEGVEALDEAIAVLQTFRPALPLEVSPGLSDVSATALGMAASETLLINTTTTFTQSVSGTPSPLLLIARLLIDDGQSNRPRRQALFDPAYRIIGVACEVESESMAQTCVITYAGSASDRIPTQITALPPVTPATPDVPDVPETPQVVETPQVPETPEIPETPETPQVVETPEIPEVPETPQVVETPEVPETPETPEVPETPETPQVVETPEVPETPETPSTTDLPTPANPDGTDIAVQPSATGNPPTPPEVRNDDIASLINPDPQSISQGFLFLRQGMLEGNDRQYEDGSFYDEHLFEGQSGQSITIQLRSNEFDTFLAIFNEDGSQILAQNDDANGESNSSVTITLPYDGVYRVFVNGYGNDDLGQYTITIR
jgi:outer membrane biosynthesis protein TonB